MTLRRTIPSAGIGTGNQVNPVSVTTLLDGYAYVRYVANAAALESVNYPNIGNTWWTNRTTLPKGLTAADQTAPIIAGYPTVTGIQAWEIPAINRLSGSVEYNESGNLEIFAEPSFTVWNPEDREVAGNIIGFRTAAAPYLCIEGVGDYGSVGSAIRALNGYSTGKHYWEVTLDSVPDGALYAMSIGLDGSSFGAGENGDYMNLPMTQFSNRGLWGYTLMKLNSGNFVSGVTGDGSPGFSVTALTTGQVLRFAYDADAGYLWVGVDGTWLNSGDPAGGTNPAVTGIAPVADSFWGDVRPVAFLTAGVKVTANFGSQAWTAGGPPVGFAGCAYTRSTVGCAQVWDTDTASFDATEAVVGVRMETGGPTTAYAHRLLGTKASFQIATTFGEPHSILGGDPRSTGRMQFEVVFEAGFPTQSYVGLVPDDWDNQTGPRPIPGRTADSFGFDFATGTSTTPTGDGDIYAANVDVGNFPQSAVGTIATFDCDFAAGTVAVYRNGVLVGTYTLPVTGKPWVPVAAGGVGTVLRLVTSDLTYPVGGATNWNVMGV